MRIELEDRLREKYPQLFRNLRVDPMACPLGRGVEMEDGWFDLLDRLCERISAELDRQPDDTFTLVQVKQKFGVLRIYTTTSRNTTIGAMIATAVEESRTVCERCGTTEATLVTRNGTMRTHCRSCREKLS